MKYLASIVITLCILLICSSLDAQNLSKTEAKQIKAELKSFKKNPLMYKLKIQKLKNSIDDQEEEIKDLDAKAKANRKTIKKLNDSLTVLHSAIDLLVEEAEQNAVTEESYAMDDNFSDESAVISEKDPPGTVYKVQVGHFEKLNLTEYFKSPKLFSLETSRGGFTYNIGNFTSYENAKKFAEDMRKLGIVDAFVTKYNNGNRVD
ncbi:MAG: hypothetical protein HKN92_05985 [Chitinophagales bacterium]|nr:hypothetical protein [Chitinophagales bacterium]